MMRFYVVLVVGLIHFSESAVNVMMTGSVPYSAPSLDTYIPSSDVDSSSVSASYLPVMPNPTVINPTNVGNAAVPVPIPTISPNYNVGNTNIGYSTAATVEDIYIDIDEDPIIKKRLKLLCTITREKLKRKNLPQERRQKLKNRLKNRCSQFDLNLDVDFINN